LSLIATPLTSQNWGKKKKKKPRKFPLHQKIKKLKIKKNKKKFFEKKKEKKTTLTKNPQSRR
jgi:hypothetical protein